MTRRFAATLAGLVLAGSASAQPGPTTIRTAPRVAAAPMRSMPRLPIPLLPPGCLDATRPRPVHPMFPDFVRDNRWQAELGISADQARRVQQLFEERRKDDKATCEALRGIVGDKAMDRWSALSALPPPPPPPPAPDAPRPPEPPVPPSPPVAAQ